MKKLILDELQVESFDTTPMDPRRGTVHGLNHTEEWTCPFTCNHVPTYCGHGCGYTDDDTECHGGSVGCTQMAFTCAGPTCVNGQTDCGSCAPDATCDGSYTCQGTSYDLEIC